MRTISAATFVLTAALSCGPYISSADAQDTSDQGISQGVTACTAKAQSTFLKVSKLCLEAAVACRNDPENDQEWKKKFLCESGLTNCVEHIAKSDVLETRECFALQRIPPRQ